MTRSISPRGSAAWPGPVRSWPPRRCVKPWENASRWCRPGGRPSGARPIPWKSFASRPSNPGITSKSNHRRLDPDFQSIPAFVSILSIRHFPVAMIANANPRYSRNFLPISNHDGHTTEEVAHVARQTLDQGMDGSGNGAFGHHGDFPRPGR
ncbi:hypothetical protein DESC_720116 [Desulfosarcina cetonica]|nr:hypothetical protein DESC_720116 [Desulfosarcina cetonica]